MTVTSETNSAGPFLTNGSTTVFPFPFDLTATSDLEVHRTTTADADDTVLVEGSQYAVTLSPPGGYITTTTALATGYKLTLVRRVAMTQNLGLASGDAYLADSVEAALDRRAMVDLYLAGELARVPVPPASWTGTGQEWVEYIARSEVSGTAAYSGMVALSGYASLAAAITALGVSSKTLVMDVPSTLTADLIIPSTVALLFTPGSVIDCNGQDLTLEGSVLGDPRFQIFNINGGTVTFGTCGTVNVQWFGARGDGVTDDTLALQGAINAAVTTTQAKYGNTVYLPAGIYITTGLTLLSRSYLRGDGIGASIIRLKWQTVAHVLTVPKSVTCFGLQGLTVDGNRTDWTTYLAANAGCDGLHFDQTDASHGSGFEVFDKNQIFTEHSYKHCTIRDCSFSSCRNHGIYLRVFNFLTRLDGCTCNYNLGHGLSIEGTDAEVSNLCADRNGAAGVYANSYGSRFSHLKLIFCGISSPSYAALHVVGDRCHYVAVECQDNYTHGFYVSGSDNTFVSCNSDSNGYDKVLGQNYSAGLYTGYYVTGPRNIFLACFQYDYHKAVLPGSGTYAALKPFDIQADQLYVDIQTPGDYYQQVGINARGEKNSVKGGSVDREEFDVVSGKAMKYLDSRPGDVNQAAGLWLGRYTAASPSGGFRGVIVGNYDNTAGQYHILRGVGENASFCTSGGGWNNGHLTLGQSHLWIDTSGRLRISATAPTSDTGGAVVGTQT